MNLTNKDWYRLLRMIAINRHHLMQLFHESCGIKIISFETILQEVAEDFDVPLKKLQDVQFAPYEGKP